jgi:proteasome lid subunit RPN8/RPN11
MVLQIRASHIEAIQAHAEQAYPEECCGLMLGLLDHDAPVETRRVVELRPTQNTWTPDIPSDPAPEAQNVGLAHPPETAQKAAMPTEIAASLPDTSTQAMRQDEVAAHADSGKSDEQLTKERRYWIDPQDLFAAQRYARRHNLDIIGIYHSHPDHAAVPSECDRAYAWAQYSYVIVSIQQGNAHSFQSWSLNDQHQFEAEEILTLEFQVRELS